jgi:hypothetical protein
MTSGDMVIQKWNLPDAMHMTVIALRSVGFHRESICFSFFIFFRAFFLKQKEGKADHC